MKQHLEVILTNKIVLYSIIYNIFFIYIDLERKISVRANRDELIQKGILFLDSPMAQTHTISESGMDNIFVQIKFDCFIFIFLQLIHLNGII